MEGMNIPSLREVGSSSSTALERGERGMDGWGAKTKQIIHICNTHTHTF